MRTKVEIHMDQARTLAQIEMLKQQLLALKSEWKAVSRAMQQASSEASLDSGGERE